MASEYLAADLTQRILGCALVHAALGPGLLESAYRACLTKELSAAGLSATTETPITLTYQGNKIDCAYRADVIVEQTVLLELKCVKRLKPIHTAQALTYMKLAKLPVGLVLNFNTVSLRDGIRRLVLSSLAGHSA
jgi:GxxExxY protein